VCTVQNQIIRVEQTESTNVHLLRLSENERLPEGVVLVAGYQTHGRGQGVHAWESEREKNLTFSIVLYPTFVKGAEQFVLSEVVSLAVRDFIAQYVGDVSVKWPNDVYVGDRKITGILIENFIKGGYLTKTVVGIGININQTAFVSDAPNPVSLRQLTGLRFNLEDCLHRTLQCLNDRYDQLRRQRTDALHSDYLSHLYRFDQWKNYIADGEIFEARITGVNKYGILEMCTRSNELKTFGFKEVAIQL
jgi:BirA family biotin operon repressor/biotin-[acetyl-CoA-carboxylase] ligase